VMVDEASMVDLALMAKLVRALPPEARLILLGDKDQLASVEAGAVLGDICDTGNTHPFSGRPCEELGSAPAGANALDSSFPLPQGEGQGEGKTSLEAPSPRPSPPCPGERDLFPGPNSTVLPAGAHQGTLEGAQSPGIGDCIVELRKSYRFGGASGIGAVSRTINAGDGSKAFDLLNDPGWKDVSWRELPRPEALAPSLRDVILQGFSSFLQAPNFPEMFAAFEAFRILCALRQGPYGVVALNRLVENTLNAARLIQPGQWYRGRPIMITANDYNLRLFNGDIGIIMPGDWAGVEAHADQRNPAQATPDHPARDAVAMESQSALYALFPAPGAAPRKFPPARLPAHETAYAMTVHKSQGSEFDEVLLLLSDRASPVLTRELLYTGITRARQRVSVWGRETVFRSAVASRIQRSSGLRDAIWGAGKT
jgi:exodeoxyribonuclease V alpha subunit